MNDTITRVVITVGIIWGVVAAIAFLWDRIDGIRRARQADPWDCPQSCGQEYGYWCQHLAVEARCPAVDEHGRQCVECRGHDTDDLTWPGFAVGHTHAQPGDDL